MKPFFVILVCGVYAGRLRSSWSGSSVCLEEGSETVVVVVTGMFYQRGCIEIKTYQYQSLQLSQFCCLQFVACFDLDSNCLTF